MKIKKHSNGWYYAHLTGGQTVNLKTKSKDEAGKLVKAARLDEIEFASKAKLLTAETMARLSGSGNITCEKALAEWRTWAETVGFSPNTIHQNLNYCKMFLEQQKLGSKSPSTITEKQVDEFVNPVNEDIAVGTRRQRHNAIISFTSLCVARGYMMRDPAKPIRIKMHLLTHEQKEPRERQPFTQEELKTLAALDDDFWRVAVMLGYEVGLRISDVAQLEWASLTKPGQIVVWTDKRDKRIAMKISTELSKRLQSLPHEHERYVFPEHARNSLDATRRAQLSMKFNRVLIKQGIEGKSFHSLRHSFASNRSALGDSIDEIREKMGHTLTDTTEGYIHK